MRRLISKLLLVAVLVVCIAFGSGEEITNEYGFAGCFLPSLGLVHSRNGDGDYDVVFDGGDVYSMASLLDFVAILCTCVWRNRRSILNMYIYCFVICVDSSHSFQDATRSMVPLRSGCFFEGFDDVLVMEAGN